jgi:YVTN family beta-propeller protein
MIGAPVGVARVASSIASFARVWLVLLVLSLCGATAKAQGPYAFVGSGSSANCCLVVIDTSTNAVVASIPITGLGIPFALAPDNSKIYIADLNNNLLDIIDTASKTLETAISAPGQPNAAVATPDGKFIYVGANSGNVYVISLATDTVIATIPMGFQVTWVAVTPDGSSVYAAGSGAVIAQISTATNKITTTFAVPITAEQQTAGCCLAGPVFTPAGTTGYIEESSGSVGSATPGTVHVYSFPGTAFRSSTPAPTR